MHHMLKHDEKLSGLPYASFITRIFKYCHVDTTNELHMKMTPKDYEINIDVINNKMCVIYDPIIGTFKHLDEEFVEPSVPPRESGPSNKILMDNMVEQSGSIHHKLVGITQILDYLEGFLRENNGGKRLHTRSKRPKNKCCISILDYTIYVIDYIPILPNIFERF